MKHQAIQCLAFDAHQATIVAALRDQGGAIIMRATVPNEGKAILMQVRSAGARVHVAFEEGTQAQWLHDLITPHAERVVVRNTRGREGHGTETIESTPIGCRSDEKKSFDTVWRKVRRLRLPEA